MSHRYLFRVSYMQFLLAYHNFNAARSILELPASKHDFAKFIGLTEEQFMDFDPMPVAELNKKYFSVPAVVFKKVDLINQYGWSTQTYVLFKVLDARDAHDD